MPRASERRLLAALAAAAILHLAIFLLVRDWTVSDDTRASRAEPLRVRIAQAPAPPAVAAPPPPPVQKPSPTPPRPRPKPAPAALPKPPPPPPPEPLVVPEPVPLEPAPPAPAQTAAVTPTESPLEPSVPSPEAAVVAESASPEERERYVDQVGRMIEAHRRYPHAARRRRLESVVTVRLAIASDGSVAAVRTVGDAPRLFERASLEAVHDAAPFPPPPPGFVEMEVAVRYEIDR